MVSSRLRVLSEDEVAEPEGWRSLRQLAEGLDAERRGEFPPGVDEPPHGVHRRSFLAHLGASLALAGLAGCRTRPADRILPYSRQPPEVTPGVPNYYATSMVLGGWATGLVVRTSEGRPTKIEGNPDHPASLGATTVQHQASILELYDRARAGVLREGPRPASWEAFARIFGAPQSSDEDAEVGRDDGRDLAFLLEPTSSLVLARLLGRVRERYPRAGVYFWDPIAGSGGTEAARALFGRVLLPKLSLAAARVVVDLDADLLGATPLSLAYARAFAEGRRGSGDGHPKNRLYVVESGFSPTGSLADHRLPLTGQKISAFAAALVGEVRRLRGVEGRVVLPESLAALVSRLDVGLSELERTFVRAVAADLAASPGAGIVAVGARQPAATHVLAELVNAMLGNHGETVAHVPSGILEHGEPSHALLPLANAIDSGRVQRLVILGGNPAYSAPPELDFARLLHRVPRSAYLGLYEDETGRATTWFLPRAHYLESWGDARAYDGTISMIQPLIEPLHGGRTAADVLAVFLGERAAGREHLARSWRAGDASTTSEDHLSRALRDGFLPGTAFAAAREGLDLEGAERLLASASVPAAAAGLELSFWPDSRVLGGELTNNPWLLELPDPLTKLTWGNAALLAPETARRFDLETGDWVRLDHRGRSLETPIFVLPGHPVESVGLMLGWGRRVGPGSSANDVGVDVGPLRSGVAPWFEPGVRLRKIDPPVDGDATLAVTQEHWSLEGRDLAESYALADWVRSTKLHHDHDPPPTLRGEWPRTGPQWGMAIDLGACSGCSACVVACQSENNVLVVGKVNVQKSREMHWLRIDRYFTGPVEAPGVVMQPMLCQHCEHAPCEYVCPVNATVHSDDGLNDMVYNRCVGTRFCSNNCPYKVRRFNWFDWSDSLSATEKMAMNPDVTVRSRGVMEKCTFCVQRIRRAGIEARRSQPGLEGVAPGGVRDGDLMTACQQACPTRAITFGDVSDPTSAVSRLQADPHAYGVLEDTGTRPRVRYLARLRNENPALAGREVP